MSNIVSLYPGRTVREILEHALEADLESVTIVGVKKNGENYFRSADTSTLKDVAWHLFVFQDCARRMLNGEP